MTEKPISRGIGNNSLISKFIIKTVKEQRIIKIIAFPHLGIFILLFVPCGGLVFPELPIWVEGFLLMGLFFLVSSIEFVTILCLPKASSTLSHSSGVNLFFCEGIQWSLSFFDAPLQWPLCSLADSMLEKCFPHLAQIISNCNSQTE